VLGAGDCLLAAGGLPATAVEPLDADPARLATLADLEAACRLADALPEVAVVGGPPLRTAPADDLAAQATAIARTLHATAKHVQLTALTSPALATVAADLAAALRDGEQELRRRPPLSLLGGADCFAAAAVFARRGLPAGALVSAPATPDAAGVDPAPADVTWALVAFVADVLAANAAIQALAPGAAFVAPVWPALAGLPATGPAAAAFVVAATQVLARAGLPAAAGAFATSAPAPDWEACTDGSFAVLSAALAGAALVSGAGTLRGGEVFSARQLVADAELFSWCATIAAGIEVDDETLAVETIRQVDICGNYLGQRHTRRHMKDVWRPRLLDRGPFDAWAAGGRQGVAERAAELAGALLAEHAVEPLDAEPAAKLERIIATAGL
jgi:trimethylamine---corrinoid protein Co-methyltransferase